MILKREYKDLAHTLLCLKQQVKDSMNFARRNVPKFSSPGELFSWLKKRLTYLSDPVNKHDREPIELLMTMQTLMSGSRTYVPGAGDCDDFTIVALSSLLATGYNNLKVVLVGNSKSHPTHIYAAIVQDGEVIPFDLTNKNFREERPYKYKQVLDFAL